MSIAEQECILQSERAWNAGEGSSEGRREKWGPRFVAGNVGSKLGRAFPEPYAEKSR